MQERDELRGVRIVVPDALYYALSLLSLGALHVLCKSFPKLRIYGTTKSAPLESADAVVHEKSLVRIQEEAVVGVPGIAYEYVKNEKLKFININHKRKILNYVSHSFETPQFDKYTSRLVRKERGILFGKNEMLHDMPSAPLLFFNRIFTSINVYTMFGIILWLRIGYFLYALIIFLLMAYSTWNDILADLRKHRKAKKIQRRQQKEKAAVLVSENNELIPIPQSEVVVGDVLMLHPNSEIPCDCTLLRGTLTVDEGFVTGESMPVLKKKNAELLGGTLVINGRVDAEENAGAEAMEENPSLSSLPHPTAIAIRTSHASAKGAAFKNLTQAHSLTPLIYFDALKCIFFLSVVSLPLLIFTFVYITQSKISKKTAFVYAFDLFYSIVSPSLSAYIHVQVSLCARRLGKKSIVCKDLSAVNVSGSIEQVLFDKTGTLTETGLNVKSVYARGREYCDASEIPGDILRAIRLCHSVEPTGDRLLGDPLDVKLLEFSNASVEYITTRKGSRRCVVSGNDVQGEIHQVFDFDPNHRRMSVVAARAPSLLVHSESAPYLLYCKGSPENLAVLCQPSTLPEDYQEVIQRYSGMGYRVLTIAEKYLEASTWENREEVENNLNYLGIVIFENKLKRETAKTITSLREADVRSIMCTGDNIHTAISVARSCGIIDKHVPVVFPVMCGPPDGAPSPPRSRDSAAFPDAQQVCISSSSDEAFVEPSADTGPNENADADADENTRMDSDVLQASCFSPGPRIQWMCSDEGFVFDEILLKVRKDKDYSSYIDFVVAVEGSVLDQLLGLPDYKKMLGKRCLVYARMKPAQKSKVVELYKEKGTVAFVGDGANDCGAIQKADVGISLLSDTNLGEFSNASYAVYQKEITGVLEILKEGKCSIVTTICIMSQMIIILSTQFLAMLLLQMHFLFLSDAQAIYSDILLAMPQSVIMSRFRCSKQLTARRAPQRLLQKSTVFTLFLHVFVHSVHLLAVVQLFEMMGVTMVINQRTGLFFSSSIPELAETSQQGTGVFLLSTSQMLYSCVCFSSGSPFREKRRKNLPFLLFYAGHVSFLLLSLLAVSDEVFYNNFILGGLPQAFSLILLGPKAISVLLTLIATDIGLIYLGTQVGEKWDTAR